MTLHKSQIVLPLGPQEHCLKFKVHMSGSSIGFNAMANAATNGLYEAACATPHPGPLASQIAASGNGLGILDSGSMWPLVRPISEVWKVD